MSTKPTPSSLCDWDVNGTNCTTPTAGQVSDGYAANSVPSSGAWNELHRRFGLVAHYLLDGDIELHSITVGGGSSTFTGPIYDTNLYSHTLPWSQGVITGAASALSGSNLISTGSWSWHSAPFGATQDMLHGLAIVTASGSVADTLTYEIHKVSINVSTGAVSDAIPTGGSGTITLAGGAQYLGASIPSLSSTWEPLDNASTYYVTLGSSTGTSGVSLAAYGARVTLQRPEAV